MNKQEQILSNKIHSVIMVIILIIFVFDPLEFVCVTAIAAVLKIKVSQRIPRNIYVIVFIHFMSQLSCLC